MLFQINSMWQILGWVLVFAGLIITNEIERRTKKGGIFFFGIVLAALTVYFVAIQIGANTGASWALNSQTLCCSCRMYRFHVIKVQNRSW